MDIDEEAFREGRVSARLYGYMRAPDDAEFMQERKSGGGAGSAEESANLAAFLANSMKPGTLYLIGSGSTTMRLKERLGINGSLLGVDAVKDGAQLGKDLTSEQIKNLLSAESPENRALIITVIGGQGHIFGRGNQQLSPEVIKMFPPRKHHSSRNAGKNGRPLRQKPDRRHRRRRARRRAQRLHPRSNGPRAAHDGEDRINGSL